MLHLVWRIVGKEAGIQVLPVMVALGTWGLAHRACEHRLRVRPELLRDGGPELVAAMMDELRKLHLGVPSPDADAFRPGETLRGAYKAALNGLSLPYSWPSGRPA